MNKGELQDKKEEKKEQSSLRILLNPQVEQEPERFIIDFEQDVADSIAEGRKNIREKIDASIEWGDIVVD